VRAAHPELDCFDSLLLSCDLGVAKPDPEIFHRACRIAGAEPSRCFFVDDTRVNVDAARTLGFQTHWFRGVPGLLHSLRSAGTKGLEDLT
jgi:HAD superfamily hydrolase (TIGR01509 family)